MALLTQGGGGACGRKLSSILSNTESSGSLVARHSALLLVRLTCHFALLSLICAFNSRSLIWHDATCISGIWRFTLQQQALFFIYSYITEKKTCHCGSEWGGEEMTMECCGNKLHSPSGSRNSSSIFRMIRLREPQMCNLA